MGTGLPSGRREAYLRWELAFRVGGEKLTSDGNWPSEWEEGSLPPMGAANVEATPTAQAAASISLLRDSF